MVNYQTIKWKTELNFHINLCYKYYILKLAYKFTIKLWISNYQNLNIKQNTKPAN